jgi:phage baseplate assembly protein W
MALEKSLYTRTVIPSYSTQPATTTSRTYKGLSTVGNLSNTFALYDIGLIKQDLLNHFHIRRGEKLENPSFGTIIWDILFDPLTDDLIQLIIQDVTTIVNTDPRVKVDSLNVTQFEMGIQIECVLTYLPYNISEQLRLKFDESNNILK